MAAPGVEVLAQPVHRRRKSSAGDVFRHFVAWSWSEGQPTKTSQIVTHTSFIAHEVLAGPADYEERLIWERCPQTKHRQTGPLTISRGLGGKSNVSSEYIVWRVSAVNPHEPKRVLQRDMIKGTM